MAKTPSSTSKKSSSVVRKSVSVSTGAPSQKNQSSRKGKKAWRKHIDIEDVEQGLDELRAEERDFGKALQKHDDHELFQIDVKGNDNIRKHLPRFDRTQLTSTKILTRRSAVPAVFSRFQSSNAKRKVVLSLEEKAKLLRIAKRPRCGPFNTVIDPTEFGAGSAILEVSEAVKKSGRYDPWSEDIPKEPETKDGLDLVQTKKIKAPSTSHPKDVIDIPAIAEPHQGTSYNPPVAAHQELLLVAHQIEERRIEEARKLAEVKEKIEKGRLNEDEVDEGVAPGMQVDKPSMEDTRPTPGDNISIPKKMPERKTKAQKNKAAKLLAERRVLTEKTARKRMLATIDRVKTLRRATDQALSAREQAQAQRRLALREKLKRGPGGQKLGKHRVPEGEIDVQLGEELSESFRALKPEGNLFRDRFISLQQRALIEPRVPVIPKKRAKVIEYEKHAWKRFE